MKKYRIKSELKKYFTEQMGADEVVSLEDWNTCGVSLQALEEVPSRIELVKNYRPHTNWSVLYKKDHSDITPQEKDLCEKALNGELLDIDSLDEIDFEQWYYNENLKPTKTIDLQCRVSELSGIKAVLKQYLKEK